MSGLADLREFGESAVSAVLERAGRGVSRVQERTPLSYDVLESDDAYLVVFDAPGATRSDIQVRFVEGEVIVKLDRFRDFHEGFEMRFPGRGLSLDGRAELPDDDVDAESATATLVDNGVLRVRIPKVETGHDVVVEEESGTADESDDGTGAPDESPGSDATLLGDADESDVTPSDDAEYADDESDSTPLGGA